MAELCPTCLSPLRPDNGPRPGTSRVDNQTEVCAQCSELEGLLDMCHDWREAMRLQWAVTAAVGTLRERMADERGQ